MENKIEIIGSLDFTSERKCMSTIVSGYKNHKDLLLKGAPDRIIDKCVNYMRLTESGEEMVLEFTREEKKRLMWSIDRLCAQGGLRCLALAEIPNANLNSNINKENFANYLSDVSKYDEYEQNATFLGVVCIKDPVRPEVRPAIKQCLTAGIRVIMITGDSKETATSIAKETGILTQYDDLSNHVFTG